MTEIPDTQVRISGRDPQPAEMTVLLGKHAVCKGFLNLNRRLVFRIGRDPFPESAEGRRLQIAVRISLLVLSSSQRGKISIPGAVNKYFCLHGIEAAFAVETGPEPGKLLGEFLDSLGAGGVRVNFDPANLVMCVDDRPENALKYLGKYVVHTHAKDGIMLKKKVEEAIEIGAEAKEHKALLEMGHKYLELPLGEGDVNFDVYLPALAETGFNGFLTIEREVGNSPEKDIALAVGFLKEKLAKFNLG